MFLQCKHFKKNRWRKNTCGSFLPTPNPWKYLNNLLQASFRAVISLKVLALEKRNYTRQNCQNHTFNLICMSFRSDKKHESQTPKGKDIKKESTATDLLFVSTAISLEVFTVEKRNYIRQNCQNQTFDLICISLRSDEK